MKVKGLLLLGATLFSLSSSSYATNVDCNYCKAKTSDAELKHCIEQCIKSAELKKVSEPTSEAGSDLAIAKAAGWDIQFTWDKILNVMDKVVALKKPIDAPFGGDGTYPLLGFSYLANSDHDRWFVLLGPLSLLNPIDKLSNKPSIQTIARIGNYGAVALDLTVIRNSRVFKQDDFVIVNHGFLSKYESQLRNAKELIIRIPTKEFGKVDVTWDLTGIQEVFNIFNVSQNKNDDLKRAQQLQEISKGGKGIPGKYLK